MLKRKVNPKEVGGRKRKKREREWRARDTRVSPVSS